VLQRITKSVGTPAAKALRVQGDFFLFILIVGISKVGLRQR